MVGSSRETPSLFLIVALLAGCDPIYGVGRYARLVAMPNLDCVQHAIFESRGVVAVQPRVEPGGGTELTVSGTHALEPVYYFTYNGAPDSEISATVWLQQNWRGYVDYHQDDLLMNRKPPQTQIDATRPVMRAVERRLAIECGAAELPAGVTEECTGVECPPLPGD